MKIEETEDKIRLIPENNYEKEKLRTLKKRGVERVQFQDAWNGEGPLELHFLAHPWNKH